MRNQSDQDPLNFPIKINNRLASLLRVVNTATASRSATRSRSSTTSGRAEGGDRSAAAGAVNLPAAVQRRVRAPGPGRPGGQIVAGVRLNSVASHTSVAKRRHISCRGEARLQNSLRDQPFCAIGCSDNERRLITRRSPRGIMKDVKVEAPPGRNDPTGALDVVPVMPFREGERSVCDFASTAEPELRVRQQ